LGRRGTNRYLIGLAEGYEREAAELETAGNKPQRPQRQEDERPDRPPESH
jgi:hypothetical protein